MKVRFATLWKTLFTKRWLFRFALLLPIAYSAVGVYFYYCDQSKWLTEPNVCPPGFFDTDFNCVQDSFVVPATESAQPHVVHYRKYNALTEPRNRTVFYLHGNKGNMSLCEWEIEPFLSNGYDVWTMDYREFGDSTGKLSESALKEDAKKVYDKIVESGVDENDIVAWGRSFGSGVAASMVTAGAKPGRLVLETPYWSIPDAARSANFLLPDFLFHFRLPVHRYLASANCPIDLIHGTHDEKIPFSSSERLYRLCFHEMNLKVGRHAIMCGPHNLRSEPEFENIVKEILK